MEKEPLETCGWNSWGECWHPDIPKGFIPLAATPGTVDNCPGENPIGVESTRRGYHCTLFMRGSCNGFRARTPEDDARDQNS